MKSRSNGKILQLKIAMDSVDKMIKGIVYAAYEMYLFDRQTVMYVVKNWFIG
jgi:hypothetical protein